MKLKNLFSILSLTSLILTSCQSETAKTKNSTLINGDFETVSLNGWTVLDGNAYKDGDFNIGIASGDFYAQGNAYLTTSVSATGSSGTLRSSDFKVTGNGKIGYLIGGGNNTEEHYLELCSSDTDQVLMTFYNTKPLQSDEMFRQVVDASKYVDQYCYIKIVEKNIDIDSYNYFNLDDFIIGFEGEAETPGLLGKANRYIKDNKGSVDKSLAPSYHLYPPVGWMNDPNGFIYYKGEYHVFYQFYPYSTAWGTMHWGHATSKDLITWEDHGAALAPDESYDKGGVFSGGAIEVNDDLYLLYTAVTDAQRQAIAYSSDGINFEKYSNNPFMDTDLLPSTNRTGDFRDPTIFSRNGYYYVICGGKYNSKGGNLMLFKSKYVLGPYSYVGEVQGSDITDGGIFECPDIDTLGDKDILISSPQTVPTDLINDKFQNVHSVCYEVGNLNTSSGKFEYATDGMQMEEFDKGFDFYAAQMTKASDGRLIMLAWMSMWDRNYPSSANNYTGSVTLPRELSLVGNHIYQKPITEIKNYYKNHKDYGTITTSEQILEGANSKTSRISFEIGVDSLDTTSKSGVKLFENDEGTEYVGIYYNKETSEVVFDRSYSGTPFSANGKEVIGQRYCKVNPVDGKIKLEIFMDRTSVECFINDGYYTMTGLAYPTSSTSNISLYGTVNTTFENVEYDEIEVN